MYLHLIGQIILYPVCSHRKTRIPKKMADGVNKPTVKHWTDQNPIINKKDEITRH